MTDKDLVQEAYGALFQKIFVNFFDAFTLAQGDEAAEAAAERRYEAMVVHARFVRDRALGLL